jgi:hypothetical protein
MFARQRAAWTCGERTRFTPAAIARSLSQVHGHEGGRACGVDGHRGALEAEIVGKPTGKSVECVTGGVICIERGFV